MPTDDFKKHNRQLELFVQGLATIIVRIHSKTFDEIKKSKRINLTEDDIEEVRSRSSGGDEKLPKSDYIGEWRIDGDIFDSIHFDRRSGNVVAGADVFRILPPEDEK